MRAPAPLAAPPLARLVAPAPAPCGAAARQKQSRVRQPAAQPPQAWVRAPAPLAAPPPARLVAPAPAPCGAAARQKQSRVRQPAAQPPQAWEKPPAYALHEDAKTWQVIGGVELDQLLGSCVPDQVMRDWPAGIRVVQAFKMGGNEGSMQKSGWEWYRGKVCKKYKCFKDDSGAAYVWVRFDGDPYDCRLRTESLKRGGDAFLVRQVPPACGAA